MTSQDFAGIRPVVAFVDRLSSHSADHIQSAVQDLANRGVQHAKHTTLFKIGSLQEHIILEKHGPFGAAVVADREYAYYLEEGNNQAGEYIYPIQAKVLHFQVDGEDVFTSRVRAHEGYHFMQAARDQVEQEAPQVIQQHLLAAIKAAE